MLDAEQVILVIPVWNDSGRLTQFAPELVSAIRASNMPIHLVIADDGSTESEFSQLQLIVETVQAAGQSVDLLRLTPRSRKGGAIYLAWDRFPNADWLAFADADGAASGESIVRLIDQAMKNGPNSCTVGVRRNTAETKVQRTFGRYCGFHLFRFLVRCLIGLKLEDTQCGAKVISGSLYRRIQDKLSERGFIFDVELLLLIQRSHANFSEYPIPWIEKQGGRVHPACDVWGMLAGLWRIRQRLHSGRYKL